MRGTRLSQLSLATTLVSKLSPYTACCLGDRSNETTLLVRARSMVAAGRPVGESGDRSRWEDCAEGAGLLGDRAGVSRAAPGGPSERRGSHHRGVICRVGNVGPPPPLPPLPAPSSAVRRPPSAVPSAGPAQWPATILMARLRGANGRWYGV